MTYGGLRGLLSGRSYGSHLHRYGPWDGSSWGIWEGYVGYLGKYRGSLASRMSFLSPAETAKTPTSRTFFFVVSLCSGCGIPRSSIVPTVAAVFVGGADGRGEDQGELRGGDPFAAVSHELHSRGGNAFRFLPLSFSPLYSSHRGQCPFESLPVLD